MKIAEDKTPTVGAIFAVGHRATMSFHTEEATLDLEYKVNVNMMIFQKDTLPLCGFCCSFTVAIKCPS